jgi:hypothetical protein
LKAADNRGAQAVPDYLYATNSDYGWGIFLLLTVALGASAAYASGKAIAQTWRPYWHIPLYMLPLALAVRFCHFALFEEPLLSLASYLVDYSVLFLAASLGYRIVRTRQMAGQYGWLYRRAGPVRWRKVP